MKGFTFKSFELSRKTQVGNRIDSFNSIHFHLPRQIRGSHLLGVGVVGMQNLNPLILNFRIVSILKITEKLNMLRERGSNAPCSLSRIWTN